jgi:hypothetical protein
MVFRIGRKGRTLLDIRMKGVVTRVRVSFMQGAIMFHASQRARGLSATCRTALLCIAMAAMPAQAEDFGETRSLQNNNQSMQNLDRELAGYRQQREAEARALEEARLKSDSTCGLACKAAVSIMIFGIISALNEKHVPTPPSAAKQSPAGAPASER